MRKLIFANQKGGVAKTSTALNVAYEIARQNNRVLFIDLDPQASATSSVFGNLEFDEKNIYQVLTGPKAISDVTVHAEKFKFDIVPSHVLLSGFELQIANRIGRERLLEQELNGLPYDIAIVDCPPSLGLLTINALTAADEVFIPICPEYFSLKGIILFQQTMDEVKKQLGASFKFRGVIITRYRSRIVAREAVEEVRKFFGPLVFETVIPENIRVEESHNAHIPVAVLDKKCKATLAFKELAKEVLS
ncbi:MAG: ParA family protein [Planctomycetota bacterium]|nr:MAG: ParA family protein [Planctomycetota bacterium]